MQKINRKSTFVNGTCRILITLACILLALTLVSQIQFTIVVKKSDAGFIQSVGRLVSGAVGTYKSVMSLGE